MATAWPTNMLALCGATHEQRVDLTCALLGEFAQRTLDCTVIDPDKTAHTLDFPGKDSYELRRCGLDSMILSGDSRYCCIGNGGTETLEALLNWCGQPETDLVLLTANVPWPVPKLELLTPVQAPQHYRHDEQVIAFVGATVDSALPLPVLRVDAPALIADFILEHLI